MKWLAECSAAALGEALRVVAPELSGFPVTVPVPDPAVKGDPLWWSSSTVVGERFTVKFAWSRPAALRLAHEISVLTALAREPRVPFLPEVVASSTDPVLLITRLMPRGIVVRGHGTLRLVVDLETAGAAEPEYDLRHSPARIWAPACRC
jgi:hypothetical protein